MSSIVLLLVGILMVWAGVTDKAGELVSGISGDTLPGYIDISLSRFMVGAVVVSMPVFIMESNNQRDWSWRYVLLISTMMLIVNSGGLNRFVNYLNMGSGAGSRPHTSTK